MKIRLLPAPLLVLVFAGPFLVSDSFAGPASLSGAEKLVADGRYFEAEKELEALTAKSPKKAEAWALLGETRLNLTDLEGAEAATTTALDLVEDKNADYWKLLGRISFEKGIAAYKAGRDGNTIKSWFADAEMKFGMCLDQNPDDPEVRCLLGWAKEWQEYPEKAKALYAEQIRKFPKEADGYVRLGAMLSTEANGIGGGQTEEASQARAKAIEIFDKGLENAGPNAEILYLKGMALEWERQRDEAKECYRKAIDADPEYEKAWARLNKLREPPSALLERALAVLKQDRASATAATWAAYLLIQQGEYEKALEASLPALSVHRENGLVYTQAFSAADRLFRSGRDKQAGIDALESVHEYYTLAGSAANNLGMYYRDVNVNYPAALEWYLKAVEREPNSQDIVNDAALIYLFHMKGDQKKKSLPLLQHVIGLVIDEGYTPERGYWDALENLCKYYWEVDRQPEKVLEYAKRRYEPINGVDPYNMSPQALHYKKLAEQALGK